MLAALWLVLVGWLTLWPFLDWWTTHFVITDRRVMFRHGLGSPAAASTSRWPASQRRVQARRAGRRVLRTGP
jgi:hypothetical protein